MSEIPVPLKKRRVQNLDQNPEQNLYQNPDQIPEQNPYQNPEQNLYQNPEQNLYQNPDQIPDEDEILSQISTDEPIDEHIGDIPDYDPIGLTDDVDFSTALGLTETLTNTVIRTAISVEAAISYCYTGITEISKKIQTIASNSVDKLRLIRAQYNLQKFNNLLEKHRENKKAIIIGDITRILDIEDLLFDYISFVLPEKIGHLKVLLPKSIKSGLVKEHILNVHTVLLPLDVSRAYEEYRNIRHIEEKIDKLFPRNPNISLNEAIDEIFKLFNKNFTIDGFSINTLGIVGRLHFFKYLLVSHDNFELDTSTTTTIDYIKLFADKAVPIEEYFESLS